MAASADSGDERAGQLGQEVLREFEEENDIADLDDLLAGCRSYRRYDATDPIEGGLLVTFVNLARRCSNSGNLQRLRYRVVDDAAGREAVFSRVTLGGAPPEWKPLERHERPSGYVVICATSQSPSVLIDCGIAAQTMAVAASAAGYGSCMLRSFAPDLGQVLGIPGELSVLLVMAFGKPAERVVLEKAEPGGSLAGWHDEKGIYHVPKLGIDDVLV
ncbi:MAG: nitroreductase family protein [Atopobiaceae bacterium]|jgi:nitroreductase|nr:nitroreductase family protein [Atopobiaceae bacterium]MCH4119412.1 nitroreductase family protein [Atopobiaceae bacterium]MCI1318122.1 nitroreductase family protein [Atopobiaceae bacterium]MCI1388999.1 nitroreductase family protein [Atopobiaceae bacterium]MCI1431767.1 nitroreductase family protein [Atopobiaceae bacterium]